MRPKTIIAISACLLGRACRYDGKSKGSAVIQDTLSEFVEWLPICPEEDSGLPTPRPPMSLYRQEDGSVKMMTREGLLDKTSGIMAWISKNILSMGKASAFILKSKSPSCGNGTTPVFGDVLPGSGLFASAVKNAFPCKPIYDENDLDTPEKCLAILGACGSELKKQCIRPSRLQP